MITIVQFLLFAGVLFGFIVYACQQAGFTLQTAINIFSTFLMVATCCAVFLVLVSCGVNVAGDTTHTVQGEATVRVEVALDYCKDVPAEQKLECMETFKELVELLKNDKELDEIIGELEGGV